VRSPRQCLQARLGDGSATPQAGAERPGVESGERRIDQVELDVRPVAEGEVALLREDLAGGGSLRAVGHLPGRLDRLIQPTERAPTLVEQSLPERLEIGRPVDQLVCVHRVMLADGLSLRDTPHGTSPKEVSTMAIAKDPVCGMDVDTETSLLSYEHEGTTYWFCGKGCMLEFKDDPERFLDPGYQPSM
jgi:YHS domain-containing protein